MQEKKWKEKRNKKIIQRSERRVVGREEENEKGSKMETKEENEIRELRSVPKERCKKRSGRRKETRRGYREVEDVT